MIPLNSPTGPPGPAADRLVRLQSVGGKLWVLPTNPARPTTFERFPLPKLPLSLLGWCGAVADRFRQRQGRCLAITLLLDHSMRRWLPLLPTQSCGRHRANWNLLDADYAELPRHLLIAGSFQSIGSGDLFDAQRSVPTYSGIHAVERFGRRAEQRRSWLFVRADDGEAELLGDPSVITTDDLDSALRDAADRLTLV